MFPTSSSSPSTSPTSPKRSGSGTVTITPLAENSTSSFATVVSRDVPENPLELLDGMFN